MVEVQFFGRLAERFGRAYAMSLGGDIETLDALISKLEAELGETLEGVAVAAVNDVIARGAAPVRDGDVVALMPRYSGG